MCCECNASTILKISRYKGIYPKIALKFKTTVLTVAHTNVCWRIVNIVWESELDLKNLAKPKLVKIILHQTGYVSTIK